jgi:hypothetical protein
MGGTTSNQCDIRYDLPSPLTKEKFKEIIKEISTRFYNQESVRL